MHLRKIQGARLPPWQIVRNGKAFAQATRPLAFTVSPRAVTIKDMDAQRESVWRQVWGLDDKAPCFWQTAAI